MDKMLCHLIQIKFAGWYLRDVIYSLLYTYLLHDQNVIIMHVLFVFAFCFFLLSAKGFMWK